MPIYEYRCAKGHQFEVFQAISDAPVERVFHPVAVHFKGSGFYTTDYARKTSSKPSDSTDGTKPKDSGSDSKSEKKAESTSSSTKDA
jgi:putative FmdB family regulatory protein